MKLGNLFDILIGPLGWEIGLSQGLYLHRAPQHKETQIYSHNSSGIRTHDPSIRAVQNNIPLRLRGHWYRL